jgi:hypothetical protein
MIDDYELDMTLHVLTGLSLCMGAPPFSSPCAHACRLQAAQDNTVCRGRSKARLCVCCYKRFHGAVHAPLDSTHNCDGTLL